MEQYIISIASLAIVTLLSLVEREGIILKSLFYGACRAFNTVTLSHIRVYWCRKLIVNYNPEQYAGTIVSDTELIGLTGSPRARGNACRIPLKPLKLNEAAKAQKCYRSALALGRQLQSPVIERTANLQWKTRVTAQVESRFITFVFA